jgi:hypothetical protein
VRGAGICRRLAYTDEEAKTVARLHRSTTAARFEKAPPAVQSCCTVRGTDHLSGQEL